MSTYKFGFDVQEKDRVVSRFLFDIWNKFLGACKGSKISIEDIVKKTDLDHKRITSILEGRANPTASEIALLAWALGYKAKLVFELMESK